MRRSSKRHSNAVKRGIIIVGILSLILWPALGSTVANADCAGECEEQPGPPGPQGPAGLAGPQGQPGADGAAGAPGAPGPAGPMGPVGPAGPQGIAGTNGTNGTVGTNGTNGTNGVDGVAGPKGDEGAAGRDGQDFDLSKSLALNAALSLPAWLETTENFSLTGGVGFSDGGETSLGVTGIARIERSVAGFAGAAVSSDGGSWAGKAGVRVGW